jgi:hypothetical protein
MSLQPGCDNDAYTGKKTRRKWMSRKKDWQRTKDSEDAKRNEGTRSGRVS